MGSRNGLGAGVQRSELARRGFSSPRGGTLDYGIIRLAAAGTAAFSPRRTARRPGNALAWLIAMLTSVVVVVEIARADDSVAEPRQKIERMSAEEKKQLLRDHEWFMGLEKAERERLRQLHRQLQDAPDSRGLLRVMRGYCKWLKMLPTDVRAELLDLEPAERIDRIKELRDKQKDVEGLLGWIDQYVTEHQEQILQAIPESHRQRLDKEKPSPAMRRRVATTIMWRRMMFMGPRGRRPPSGRLPAFTESDLADLRSHLSKGTRETLKPMPADQQWGKIADLARDTVFRHFRSRRFKDRPLPPDLKTRLDKFFETLKEEEQDRLLKLPGDEMQERLWRMYVNRFLPMLPPARMGPGERPGPRGPGRGGPPPSKNGPRPGRDPSHRRPRPPAESEEKQP